MYFNHPLPKICAEVFFQLIVYNLDISPETEPTEEPVPQEATTVPIQETTGKHLCIMILKVLC